MLMQGNQNYNLTMISLGLMSRSKSKQLLVIAYPQDWHWAISIEYLLAQRNQDTQFQVLDISFVGQISIRSFLRWIVGGNRLRRTGLKLISPDHSVKILKKKIFFKLFGALFESYKEMKTMESILDFKNSTTIYNSCN
jgi:hypothetical protein